MPDIEVLAVEIKRFPSKSGQTLVPRVIGKTSVATPGGGLTRDSFLEGFANNDVRDVAECLFNVAQRLNSEIFYGSQGVSIRARCPVWPRPISVAWLYSGPDLGWMRTREFSFGSAVFDHDLPDTLRVALERWEEEFASDRSSTVHRA